MSTTIKFIITVILVGGFSYASYYICERKFNYANFDDNLLNLQAILKVEKSIAQKTLKQEEFEDLERDKDHVDRKAKMKNMLANDKDAKEHGLEI